MRDPKKVLNSLTKHSIVSSYKFEKLYRILFNPQMYHWACQYIFVKPGMIRSGPKADTVSAISVEGIENLVDRMRNESYQPCPAERTNNPRRSANKPLLCMPALDDKLVLHIIKMILEAIYEKQFEDCSHGFRPHRSCHTALMQVQTNCQQVHWFIEGHITGFFEHISVQVLIRILGERIADKRFIRLISKFIKAGYMQDWAFDRTYSGIPKGGIISPILANIYLDKLDKYMKGYTHLFDQATHQRETVAKQIQLVDNPKRVNGPEKPKAMTGQSARQRAILPRGNEEGPAFKELKYIRYADLFLIGVTGSINDCRRIKEQVKTFLDEQLRLELSEEKTLIVHAEKTAKFLSYQVHVNRPRLTKTDPWLARARGNEVVLRMPEDKVREKLIQCRALEFKQHRGRQLWKPKSRSWLLNKADLEIISQYKLEIQVFYNYYCLAQNQVSVKTFGYMMQHSMYKTFGRKYRLSTRQVIDKLKIEDRFAAEYTGNRNRMALDSGGFTWRSKALSWPVDQLPRSMVRHARSKKTSGPG